MQRPIYFGVDRLGEYESLLSPTTRVALLTNGGAIDSAGRWVGDVIRSRCNLVLFLAPEHGLQGIAPAGQAINHTSLDEVPVWSLYGAEAAPVEESLGSVDMILIDLPDVGCRYYTYGWTVRETLRMAARAQKPVVVLDRPNPLGGCALEGNLPQHGYDSAVCASPVPVRHGFTLGELARFQLKKFTLDLQLEVIPMSGWRRDTLWHTLYAPWIPPSPALRSAAAACLYPGVCLLEGTNVSEGRGTDMPFEIMGAPFIKERDFAASLSGEPALAGVRVEPLEFRPHSGKWAGERCLGIRMDVERAEHLNPVAFGLTVIAALMRNSEFRFTPWFDALAGTPLWREMLECGCSAEEIVATWHDDLQTFECDRHSVLLYD